MLRLLPITPVPRQMDRLSARITVLQRYPQSYAWAEYVDLRSIHGLRGAPEGTRLRLLALLASPYDTPPLTSGLPPIHFKVY